ncbi:MAG: hypothetical protein DCC49_08300 [Acidobacteria bacterium]|nr:MAG: hypothetical protein DCC49_08300 [Acidobacteriota bacterium]
MLCPECGADNVTGSEWCTRCQFRFGTRENTERVGEATVTDIEEAETRRAQLADASPAPQGEWSQDASSPPQVRSRALFPDSGSAQQIDPSWVATPQEMGTMDVEYTRIGTTGLRFMILGALVLLVSAGLPTVVFTIVDNTGGVMTVMRYLPLDMGVAVGCAVLAVLGRNRTWTIIRLSIVGVILVSMVSFRYLTFQSIVIDVGSEMVQSVRLGPSWYVMALGGACLGVAWISALRGRLG